ncbi:MAG: hypothetical protein K8R64_02890 [Methanosarcinaceae archaeon]|nr:hypothetical protein [Methanosarcinaceae archaeon]
MHKLPPILLIGTLSMLFAEVFSGASQTWFINGWGILVTFPLYLAHLLFFLAIALRTKRTSLSQLYLFGVLFALYEAWITKVLWSGYMDSEGPSLGTFLGLGMAEFPILVLFWHPVMSFIVPIFVFEILTGKALVQHTPILKKSCRKTIVICMFLILVSSFIANGNGFDLISANMAVGGSLLIIAGLHRLSKGVDMTRLVPGRRGFTLLSGYLLLLYIVTFIFLLPERIPTTLTPYLSIVASYVIVIALLVRSGEGTVQTVKLDTNTYSTRNVIMFIPVLIFAVIMACSVPEISMNVLMVTYFSLMVLGMTLFGIVTRNVLKAKMSKI